MENNIEEEMQDVRPLTNITTGCLILSLWSILFGLNGPEGFISLIPWMFAGYPIIIFCVIRCFRQGALIDGTVTAVLTGLSLCQLGLKGCLFLVLHCLGKELPADTVLASGYIDGMEDLCCTVLLAFALILACKGKKVLESVFLTVIVLGFFFNALHAFGISACALPAGICIEAFGAWMLLSGCRGLMKAVLQK
ncbi:MAG TPA: hypothetical protein PLN48_02650 [Lachnospiraceae bacterium]|nr:hypothetical protein [Lachnospiraceae bacterium]